MKPLKVNVKNCFKIRDVSLVLAFKMFVILAFQLLVPSCEDSNLFLYLDYYH